MGSGRGQGDPLVRGRSDAGSVRQPDPSSMTYSIIPGGPGHLGHLRAPCLAPENAAQGPPPAAILVSATRTHWSWPARCGWRATFPMPAKSDDGISRLDETRRSRPNGRLPVLRAVALFSCQPTPRLVPRRMVSGPRCSVITLQRSGLPLTAEIQTPGMTGGRSGAPSAQPTGQDFPGGPHSSLELVECIASSLLTGRALWARCCLYCPPAGSLCEGSIAQSERKVSDQHPQRDTVPSCAAKARNARPRCENVCFSIGVISAKVRPSPSSGTKRGS